MLRNLMKKNKKKGFTLIELIIVIAILAILAIILVPQIGVYRNKAEKSNIQASAKTFQNAIDANNSDPSNTQITTVSGGFSQLTTASGSASAAIDGTNFPACLKGVSPVTSLDDLKKVVNGEFDIDVNTGATSTIKLK